MAPFLRCRVGMSSLVPVNQKVACDAPREVGGCDARQRKKLLDWLDDGLRSGRRGRLEAEYPVSLAPGTLATHRVVWDAGRPLSHAMYRIATARTPAPLRIGMIGLVYTDPDARGLGLARRCVRSCYQALEERGAAVVLLWSDKPALYAELGFRPFGREKRWWVDARLCRAARVRLGRGSADDAIELDLPRAGEWPRLEALYAEKAIRLERDAGDLERLAAAPETLCVVARIEGEVVGYAALGRGDDFCGVVHEWAGTAEAVLACLEGLCAERGPLLVQAGPEPGLLGTSLEAAGAAAESDDFALARFLDPGCAPSTSLYLWGFDSI